MKVDFEDHSAEVLEAMKEAALRGLEKCGQVAEGYAKKRCVVDTGLLRNSITHAIGGKEPAISEYKAAKKKKGEKKKRDGKYEGTAPEDEEGKLTVYIGTNVEYGTYVEMGTGKHYEAGRPDPWAYKDAKDQWHLTHGSRARPYLKPAVADHAEKYKAIIQKELKGG